MRSSGDRLLDMLAELAKINVDMIKDNSSLTTDLGLDSIARVELATLLEDEFNMEVNDSEITGEVTVQQLRRIIESRRTETDPCRFPQWAVQWPCRLLRALLQIVVLHIPSLFSRTTIKGCEHLNSINSPVIFISNHVSHYDTACILRALPQRLRKCAIAAAADIVYGITPDCKGMKRWLKRLNGHAATLLVNAFPFYRHTHVKKSFEYMGRLMDKGWHILLFPEGQLTQTGELNHFRSGVGLLAQAMQAPVIPLRLDGLFDIAHYQRWMPQKFGQITITFGQPIKVDLNANPQEVANLLEDTVRNL
jgi:long-chain acyl-CoA synthetase